jgi:hypothetical protein
MTPQRDAMGSHCADPHSIALPPSAEAAHADVCFALDLGARLWISRTSGFRSGLRRR